MDRCKTRSGSRGQRKGAKGGRHEEEEKEEEDIQDGQGAWKKVTGWTRLAF